MTPWISLTVEGIVAILMLASGFLTLMAAIGLLRLQSIFRRLHPPALTSTLSTWCISFACIIYFSFLAEGIRLQAWLIVIFLGMTTPITTVLLARTALFRLRQHEEAKVPPRLTGRKAKPAEKVDLPPPDIQPEGKTLADFAEVKTDENETPQAQRNSAGEPSAEN